MPTANSRPADGARAPFRKPRLRANKRLGIKAQPCNHTILMEASPAYRTWHTRMVLVGGPSLAEVIAQGVAQQCNALAAHLYDVDECPYPGQALLEEVINKLQSRV